MNKRQRKKLKNKGEFFVPKQRIKPLPIKHSRTHTLALKLLEDKNCDVEKEVVVVLVENYFLYGSK